MKRSEALSEIRHCGYEGNTGKMAEIAVQKNIGTAAATKAYRDGTKDKKNNWGCGCNACKAKRGEK